MLELLLTYPEELESTAAWYPGEEAQVGIGRNARVEFSRKNQLTLEAALETREDVARYRPSERIRSKARFHGMRDERFDLDDLIELSLRGNGNACAGHVGNGVRRENRGRLPR